MIKKARKSIYSVHPGVAMVQKWKESLALKTGRNLDQWLDLVKNEGPSTEKERRRWLKEKYNLPTNTAWWIAERADGKGWEEDSPESYLEIAEKYVEDMFAGPKSTLKPIYDALLNLGLSLGKDVKVCPGKTIVPFYRNHVFAQIKPSTRTRIDLGLALGKVKVPSRLIDTGGADKGDRITHRIPVSSLDDIDDQLKTWLRKAYDLDL